MKLCFRALALLLLLLTCFAVSCNKDGDSTEPATDGVSDSPLEENREYMPLDADVKILCTRQWSNEMKEYCDRIAAAIKEKSGLELEVIYKSENAGKEIVVGYLDNHAGSAEAYNSISIDQYAVCVNDSSAVVAAYKTELLAKAVEEFLARSIVRVGGEWKIASVPPTGDGNDASRAITAYRIVYAADAESYITDEIVPYIKETIASKYKIDIPAVSDAEPESEYEIVIGNTNRATDATKRLLSDTDESDVYRSAVAVDQNKLFALGREKNSLKVSVAKLLERVIYSDYGPKLFDLKSKMYLSMEMAAANERALAEGSDVRVMSYNVLNPAWGLDENRTLNKVENRIDRIIDLLLYYRPDVVGLQEASVEWHNALGDMFIDMGAYEMACKTSNGGAPNMTGFLYNPATLRVVDEYVIDIVENSDHRVVSVAVFETLADGKRFVVINTHPAPTSHASYAEHMQKINEIELVELEKYKELPVLLTGDFNTKENREEYATLVETLGVKNVKFEADVMIHNYAGTGFKAPAKCEGNRCIDHIFINANVDPKLYSAVIKDGIQYGSDHLPIYADVALGQS